MSRKNILRWLKILSIAVAVFLVSILALLIALGWFVKRQMIDWGGGNDMIEYASYSAWSVYLVQDAWR